MLRVVLAGHPFASTGMGEQLRSHVASFQSVGVDVAVFDLFRNVERTDDELISWLEPIETDSLFGDVRIFHINGDEIEKTLARLEELGQDFAIGLNIIMPAWELYHYPAIWIPWLQKFDDVWALSRWIADALERRGIQAHYIGQAVETRRGPLLPRKYFGIRESAIAFVSFCDLSSFAKRKNHDGFMRLWERLRASEPHADFQFILKIKEAEREAARDAGLLENRADDFLVLTSPLSSVETRSLISACDCCVSLHRAEGFGRTIAEAMFRGRAVLATGWSGNMDYMNEENSFVVNYDLVDIAKGEYPHSVAQTWAEPDLKHALALARFILKSRRSVEKIAALGSVQVRTQFSFNAIGLRSYQRIQSVRTSV